MSEENVVVSEESEAVVPEESSPPEVDNSDKFVERFAALSRRENEVRIKAEEAKAYQTRIKEIDSIKEQGVLKALEYHGFTVDDLINHLVGSEEEEVNTDPVEALRTEFDNYKNTIEQDKIDKQKAIEESNQADYSKAVEAHQASIHAHLSQHPDKYELITAQGQQEVVWNVTEAHFDNTGEVLSIEEASDKVESYLEEKARELLSLNKFKPKSPMAIKDTPTLTQAQTPGEIVNDNRPRTREERLAAAARALKWT